LFQAESKKVVHYTVVELEQRKALMGSELSLIDRRKFAREARAALLPPQDAIGIQHVQLICVSLTMPVCHYLRNTD